MGAVEAINLRFQQGHPTNDISEAGVLLHQFDGLEDGYAGRKWAPCHSGWCNGRYDHISVSLVSKQFGRVFNSNAGVIYAPTTQFECSFPHDGGTQSQTIEHACALNTAYAPSRLKQCLEMQKAAHAGEYNEFVVSSKYIDGHLPGVIEAIMYIDDDSEARAAHSAYLRMYKRTASQFPLVRYVPGSGFVEG